MQPVKGKRERRKRGRPRLPSSQPSHHDQREALIIKQLSMLFVFVQQPLIGFTFCPKLHITKFFFNLVFVESLGEICGTLAILLLSVVCFAEIIFIFVESKGFMPIDYIF